MSNKNFLEIITITISTLFLLLIVVITNPSWLSMLPGVDIPVNQSGLGAIGTFIFIIIYFALLAITTNKIGQYYNKKQDRKVYNIGSKSVDENDLTINFDYIIQTKTFNKLIGVIIGIILFLAVVYLLTPLFV
ncbi:hypothetical protein MBBAR_1c02390 [Methanobrevibacter arboriphilus JCM 13429 = DSM 1125]|uniref:DUF3899 domain-containing protein n=1 Tax=Methanobrevibacter arboriphilus JCM 13429 = DSM 1125 TaxID=1300164 RepID=A0A1V6N575_METAZ|nr:hypothetical protein [Methanobrevibacter arboriphilus]OQD59831.1 hypothetical protein MBBAR_1c02390 [Methanobrevibacter arboriphilus JCM 13429 = DSM 1125]